MDLILRCLNARALLIGGGAVAAIVLLARLHDASRLWREDRKFARERGASEVAADIAKDLDARQSLRLRRLYRDVSADVAAAKERGLSVDGLQAAADASLRLDAPATRALAIDSLNRLRLAIPQTPDAAGRR